jgi:Skp family chaperone for outer membrane proteins
METKIVKVEQYNPSTLYVHVDFLDGETIILSKTYPLPVDENIETLYPQFKEDLNNCEAGKQKADALQAHIDTPVDLTNVQSTSEIQAQAEATRNAQEEAQKVSEPEPELTQEANPTEPLG